MDLGLYNPGIGKFLSVDPLSANYTSLSPYSFVNNMPTGAIDPDGRLIIFVNGLWGWPNQVGEGGTISYWGRNWVRRTQAAIGDRSEPLFYDGSVGGTSNILGVYGSDNRSPSFRKLTGLNQGYRDAESIVNSLQTNDLGEVTETIKFVTNSMGAAYQRGMSEGILKWVGEENQRRKQHNVPIQEAINRININLDRIENLSELTIQVNKVEGLKKQLLPELNVRIEMVINLDAHQIDYVDPNAERSYYMISDWENRNTAEQIAVDPRDVKGAVKLGENEDGTSRMIRHHSSGATPEEFPSDEDPNN